MSQIHAEAAPADWYADPLGRFYGRFFDGVRWTDQVSDNGQLATDPQWVAPIDIARKPHIDMANPAASCTSRVRDDQAEPLVAAVDVSEATADERRGVDRRQVNLPGSPNRRKSDRRMPEIVIPQP